MANMVTTSTEEERVLLLAVSTSDIDDTEDSLDELEELVKTAGAVTAGRMIQRLDAPNQVTYIGSGKLEELKMELTLQEATGIVCDDELSPIQMKNLEDALDIKIMDRTMVILDIFAARASTSEGKIQVELAQLKYQSSRLVGLRSSLSRLGGGIGTKGPGEKKLEKDRRVIRDRITRLSHELEQVKKHRCVQRKQRSENAIPVVCIVGYTNAGKSTLLNALTKSDVLSEDKLFATLDPTTRSMTLPDGQQIMLTDTVGFIRKLPHHLINAFRSTLEEAKYSDYILHVVDCSNPQMEKQMHTVYQTLQELGVEGKTIITVFNKIDQADPQVSYRDFRADKMVRISAKTGEGLNVLQDTLGEFIRESKVYIEKRYDYQSASEIARIRQYGQVLSEEYREDGIYITAYIDRRYCRE